MTDIENPQIEKFKELASELEVDEGEAHWDNQLRKIAEVRPKSGEPE